MKMFCICTVQKGHCEAHVVTEHLKYGSVARLTGEWNLKFYFILIYLNLNSSMWLMDTIE